MPHRHAPEPLALPVPRDPVTRPSKAHPVSVRVRTTDGEVAAKDGFALAWSRDAVLVQVLWPKDYFDGAREFWVETRQVARRIIEPQWLGR